MCRLVLVLAVLEGMEVRWDGAVRPCNRVKKEACMIASVQWGSPWVDWLLTSRHAPVLNPAMRIPYWIAHYRLSLHNLPFRVFCWPLSLLPKACPPPLDITQFRSGDLLCVRQVWFHYTMMSKPIHAKCGSPPAISSLEERWLVRPDWDSWTIH